MTRINSKYTRLYTNGVDISGYASEIDSLDYSYATSPMAALSDTVKNSIAGVPSISAGNINAFLDNDTAGLFNLTRAVGFMNLMVAFGTSAEPTAGDPMFAWGFEQTAYKTGSGDGFVPVTIPASNASYSSILTYENPWGILLGPKATWTAASTAIGIDDNLAASSNGGMFIYHMISSNGTATLTVEDAATNTNVNFAALTGATSGSITAAVTPKSGIIALSRTATVRRYLRPQVTLGTATTLVAVFGFIRNKIV